MTRGLFVAEDSVIGKPEKRMSFDDREAFKEQGTGQVYYLWQDEDSRKWVIGRFAGGPDGIEPIAAHPSKEEAEEHLKRHGIVPAGN